MRRPLSTGAAVAALALSLAACQRAEQATTVPTEQAGLQPLPATLPLAPGEAPQVSYAPPVTDLPDAGPIRSVRVADPDDAYGYADAAYGFLDAMGDAPPDYAFGYDGVDPWAWQGYDDSLVFAEPVDGGWRQYFYRTGSEYPYFVRDPDYGYGYDDGQLAVVYGNDGGIVPWADYGPAILYASRYLARGHELWGAHRRDRQPVYAATWVEQAPRFGRARSRWAHAIDVQPGWGDYRRRYAARDAAFWRPEVIRREADARRFQRWREADYRTPPPPRAIPAAWTDRRWARDARRYAPVRIGAAERTAFVDARAARIAQRQAWASPARERGPGPGGGRALVPGAARDVGPRGDGPGREALAPRGPGRVDAGSGGRGGPGMQRGPVGPGVRERGPGREARVGRGAGDGREARSLAGPGGEARERGPGGPGREARGAGGPGREARGGRGPGGGHDARRPGEPGGAARAERGPRGGQDARGPGRRGDEARAAGGPGGPGGEARASRDGRGAGGQTRAGGPGGGGGQPRAGGPGGGGGQPRAGGPGGGGQPRAGGPGGGGQPRAGGPAGGGQSRGGAPGGSGGGGRPGGGGGRGGGPGGR